MKRPTGIQVMSENEDSEGTGIIGKCTYDWDKRLYTIEARHGEHMKYATLEPTFDPYFGMDLADIREANRIGDKLIEELEQELKLEKKK